MTDFLELQNKHLNAIVNAQAKTIEALIENIIVLDVIHADTIAILKELESNIESYKDGASIYEKKLVELKTQNEQLKRNIENMQSFEQY